MQWWAWPESRQSPFDNEVVKCEIKEEKILEYVPKEDEISTSNHSLNINDTLNIDKNEKFDEKDEIFDGKNEKLNDKCDVCGINFENELCLKNHEKIHEKQKECNICQKTFNTSTKCLRHIRTVHNETRNHKCKFCEKSFKIKDHLIAHINRNHLHKCEFCEEQFSKRIELKIHIKSVHGNPNKILNHKCQLCDTTFKSKCSLKKHVNYVHEGLKKHQCNICGQLFNEKYKIKNHIERVHEEQEYKCKDCDKVFQCHSDLGCSSCA